MGFMLNNTQKIAGGAAAIIGGTVTLALIQKRHKAIQNAVIQRAATTAENTTEDEASLYSAECTECFDDD